MKIDFGQDLIAHSEKVILDKRIKEAERFYVQNIDKLKITGPKTVKDYLEKLSKVFEMAYQNSYKKLKFSEEELKWITDLIPEEDEVTSEFLLIISVILFPEYFEKFIKDYKFKYMEV